MSMSGHGQHHGGAAGLVHPNEAAGDDLGWWIEAVHGVGEVVGGAGGEGCGAEQLATVMKPAGGR
jgi:hypothetical protein